MKFTNQLKSAMALIFCAQIYSTPNTYPCLLGGIGRNLKCLTETEEGQCLIRVPSTPSSYAPETPSTRAPESLCNTPSTSASMHREGSQDSMSHLELGQACVVDFLPELKRALIACNRCWKGSEALLTLTGTENWDITYTTVTTTKKEFAIRMSLDNFLLHSVSDLETVTLIKLIKSDEIPIPVSLARLH